MASSVRIDSKENCAFVVYRWDGSGIKFVPDCSALHSTSWEGPQGAGAGEMYLHG